jgi:hypothetical protein
MFRRQQILVFDYKLMRGNKIGIETITVTNREVKNNIINPCTVLSWQKPTRWWTSDQYD